MIGFFSENPKETCLKCFARLFIGSATLLLFSKNTSTDKREDQFEVNDSGRVRTIILLDPFKRLTILRSSTK